MFSRFASIFESLIAPSPKSAKMKTLKLTLLCSTLFAFTFANVSKTEKDALVALYNATNGSSWNTTWNLDQPITDWYGIKVENDQVVSIN